MYHVELRQFPHNMCRFNLSAQELHTTVLEPWARDRWIELGERKWSPHQATLTVLEGPRIPFGQLTMGRGWRAAQRDGRDVTAKLLAALGQEHQHAAGTVSSRGGEAVPAAPSAGSQSGQQAEDLAADSLGLELLSRIGAQRAPLSRAWELAGERHPDSPASATLALAERAVESLLRTGLIVLLHAEGAEGEARPIGAQETDLALARIASWTGSDAAGGVWVGRA